MFLIEDPNADITALVQVMVLCRDQHNGEKPLSEPVVAWFTDACIYNTLTDLIGTIAFTVTRKNSCLS